MTQSRRIDVAVGVLHSRTVLQKIMVLASGATVAQSCMVVNGLVLARYLTPEGYGAFAGTFAAVGVVVPLFGWGADTWILSRGALSTNLARLTGLAGTISTLSALVLGSLLVVILPGVSPNVFVRALVVVSLIDAWAENLFMVQMSALTVSRRIRTVSSLFVVLRGGRLLGAILLVIVGVGSPLVFAGARLLATGVTTLIAIGALRPQLEAIGRGDAMAMLHLSIPFGVSDLLSNIYLRAGAVLLAVFVGQSSLVGQYSAAYGLITALYVVPAAGYSIMVPEIAKLTIRSRKQVLRATTWMFAGFGLLGATMGLATWAFGSSVTELVLGPSYQTAGSLLVFLGPILVLKSLSFGCIALLVAVRWQDYRVLIQAMVVLVGLPISVMLISQSGIWGAASACLVTEAVLTAGYVLVVLRWLVSQGSLGEKAA